MTFAPNAGRDDPLACVPPFRGKLPDPLVGQTLERLDVLQVNVGRLCNLACKHCHVEAGPNRTEVMSRSTMEHCLRVLAAWGFRTLDITGGAPEMNPDFRFLVDRGTAAGVHVIVRTNLVILHESGYDDLPEFMAERGVEIVCSLPYYSERDCDRQRGAGTFWSAISMLRRLNDLGYGKDDRLALNMVYNPGGAFLPPPQADMEREYKLKLGAEYGIVFNRLFTITNNPVGRFGAFLVRSGNMAGYMRRLHDSFNPVAAEGMMCRSQLSVGWDGRLYDCDFNQALDWTVEGTDRIGDLSGDRPARRNIRLGNHCYACTAGSGSSCGGATA